MCGRFTQNLNNDFYQRFSVYNRLELLPQNINISPGQEVPIITHENLNLVWLMKWGLIPSWAKDRSIGNKMFNARAESVSTKPGFRNAFKSHRCLVPSNGYFEWKTENNKKAPYFFEVQDRPLFAFAGIFDRWEEPVGGREIYSFAIITTDSNSDVKSIHDRMPVILRPEQEQVWLDPSVSLLKLQSLFHPSSETLIITRQ